MAKIDTDGTRIRLVVFDTAGTYCDGPQDLRERWPQDDGKGCKAPVAAFYETFRKIGIEVSWGSIRKPMGMYKPDHLRLLLALPEVREQHLQKFGHPYTEEEFGALLEEFKRQMPRFLLDADLAKPVRGARECFDRLRESGILIGSDTGYYNEDAARLGELHRREYGLYPDVSTNAELVPGRPSPFMIYDCMQKAETGNIASVVKVDDTAVGIESGRNAGCWSIGVYATGSDDYKTLLAAGADYLLPSVELLPELIFTQLQPRLARGERPGAARKGA